MNSKLEFDSEFSNVKYIEKDNVVFLTWKKFCYFEAYREPTTFALQLLRQFPDSNLVVDARNDLKMRRKMWNGDFPYCFQKWLRLIVSMWCLF